MGMLAAAVEVLPDVRELANGQAPDRQGADYTTLAGQHGGSKRASLVVCLPGRLKVMSSYPLSSWIWLKGSTSRRCG